MTRLFFEMNKYDIDVRTSNEGRIPLTPLVHVHELRTAGEVVRDDHVRVTSALVDHPPVVPAFGYRFDAPDRSIVISGDTAPSESVVKLARGADVLVHSVMYPAAIDRLVSRVPNAAALKASILAHQTSSRTGGSCRSGGGCQDPCAVSLRAVGFIVRDEFQRFDVPFAPPNLLICLETRVRCCASICRLLQKFKFSLSDRCD
jgi:hypothetical protein